MAAQSSSLTWITGQCVVSVSWDFMQPAIAYRNLLCLMTGKSEQTTLRQCAPPSLHLTELQVRRNPVFIAQPPSVTDAVSFCDAVVSTCPRLVKLSITDIILGNNVAAAILRGMIDHTSLEHIT